MITIERESDGLSKRYCALFSIISVENFQNGASGRGPTVRMTADCAAADPATPASLRYIVNRNFGSRTTSLVL